MAQGSAQALTSSPAPTNASTDRGAGAAAPLASVPWWELPWESFRCRKCQRLLFKLTVDALRPGACFECKCRDCKTLNYLMGTGVETR